MFLLVGLGNPGKEYDKTRHNIGFMVIDALRKANPSTPPSMKFQGEIAETIISGVKTLSFKPMSFMNRSGSPVAQAAQFYKIPHAQVILFHDELDLPLGKAKVKIGGGHGGHNGIKSIDAHVGNETMRVRLGIGHPGHKDAVTGYVLGGFDPKESPVVATVLDAVVHATPVLVTEGMEPFVKRYQSYFNQHHQPQ